MKDDEDFLCNKIEGKTNFSRRQKEFDGLICLIMTTLFCDRSMSLIILSLSTVSAEKEQTVRHGGVADAGMCAAGSSWFSRRSRHRTAKETQVSFRPTRLFLFCHSL